MDSPTTPTPDPITNPEAAPAHAPDSVPFVPAAPEAWAPTEGTSPPAPVPARRTVTRSTLLAGIAVAAMVGVGGIGLVAGLRDSSSSAASAGSPGVTTPSDDGWQPGSGGQDDDGDGRMGGQDGVDGHGQDGRGQDGRGQDGPRGGHGAPRQGPDSGMPGAPGGSGSGSGGVTGPGA